MAAGGDVNGDGSATGHSGTGWRTGGHGRYRHGVLRHDPVLHVRNTEHHGGSDRRQSAGDEVGHSVVIGDFNGDGSDDLYLRTGRDDAGTGSGAAYTFYGLGGSEYTASTQYDAGIFGSRDWGWGTA